MFYFLCAAQNPKIKVLIAPPGARDVVEDSSPVGWEEVDLIRRDSEKVIVGRRMTKGYRRQIPILPFGVSTIHKALGLTCDRLVTRISACDKKFNLWQHEQLIVVLSRVRRFEDLYFVGEPGWSAERIKEDTFDGIRAVLNNNGPWTRHIHEMMKNLDMLRDGNLPRVSPLNKFIVCAVPSNPLFLCYRLETSL